MIPSENTRKPFSGLDLKTPHHCVFFCFFCQWLKINRVKREHRAASVVLLPFDIVLLTAWGCNRPHRERVPNLPALAGIFLSGSSLLGQKPPSANSHPCFYLHTVFFIRVTWLIHLHFSMQNLLLFSHREHEIQ